MKILALNNYDLEWSINENGRVPHHQAWGIDELRKQGHLVDTKVIKRVPVFDFLFRRYSTPILNLLFAIYIVFSLAGLKYDIIISFYSPTLTFLPFFKKLGFIKSKFITIVHHAGVSTFSLKKMDKVLFLSNEIKKNYPSLDNAETISWLPDLDFYESTYSRMTSNAQKRYSNPSLISTGKTSRDDDLLIKACEQLKLPLKLFGNFQSSAPKIVEFAPANGYLDMLKRMENCAINIVACSLKTNLYTKHLCGLTSILDGIALGMPLIYSDNCNLPFNPEKEGFGLSFKAGSLESLTNAIKTLIDSPSLMIEMGKKARLFAEKNNYKQYCIQLSKAMFN